MTKTKPELDDLRKRIQAGGAKLKSASSDGGLSGGVYWATVRGLPRCAFRPGRTPEAVQAHVMQAWLEGVN